MTGSASGGSGSSGSRAVSTSPSSSSTATACAACKYQRRKCTPDCPLSPYFPPDQPKRFQNVHKLFGVSNILRILKHVDPTKREDTVKSISYEADTREKDPVHGCLGVITILQNQVSKLKDELAVAREQLFLLQQQHNFNQQAQMQQIVSSLGGSTSIVNVSSAGQETNNVLMQNYPGYNDMTSNALPISSFEPDQYLRTDGYDQINNNNNNNNNKPGGGGGASSSRFDVGRYIRGESPLHHHHHHHQAVKEESGAAAAAAALHQQHYESTTTASTTPYGNHRQQDHHLEQQQQVFNDNNNGDPFAMAMRRRGGGPLNLTVASEADFRRTAGGGGGEHELRNAGVYLTLTN